MIKKLPLLVFLMCQFATATIEAQYVQLSNDFNFSDNGATNGVIRNINAFTGDKLSVVGDFSSIDTVNTPHIFTLESNGLLSETFNSPFTYRGRDFNLRYTQFGFNRYFNHFFTLTKGNFPSPYNNKLIAGFNNTGALIQQINLPSLTQAGLQASSEIKCATPDELGNVWVGIYQPSNQGFYLGRLLRNSGQWDAAFTPQLIATNCTPDNIVAVSTRRFCLIAQRSNVPDSATIFILNGETLELSQPINAQFPVAYHGFDNSGRTYLSSKSGTTTKIFRLSFSGKIEPNYEIILDENRFIAGTVTGDGVMAVSSLLLEGPTKFTIRFFNTSGAADEFRYPRMLTNTRYNLIAQTFNRRGIYAASDDTLNINEQNPAIIKLDVDTVVSVTGKVFVKQLSLYPNPANDKIVLLNAPLHSIVKIYSNTGRLIHTQMLDDSKTLKTERFPCGLYHIRVEADKITYTGKFILDR